LLLFSLGFWGFFRSFGQFIILQKQEDACVTVVNTPAWATKREGNRLQFHRCTKKRNSGLETKRWEAQWILSWGKSAQSSPDFTVPVYIG